LFPPEAQIIIYRIFQECLTNISKHAAATEVSMAIKEDDGLISLVLEDNGVGFDPAQVAARRAANRGLGLAALNERTRMLDGTLEIWSQPGAGTRVTCVIPVERRQQPGAINPTTVAPEASYPVAHKTGTAGRLVPGPTSGEPSGEGKP
jgi:signal transduction histidine kinase